MTVKSNTVEPNNGGVSGSLSVAKKNHSAKKKI